jgi:hypothetical protein
MQLVLSPPAGFASTQRELLKPPSSFPHPPPKFLHPPANIPLPQQDFPAPQTGIASTQPQGEHPHLQNSPVIVSYKVARQSSPDRDLGSHNGLSVNFSLQSYSYKGYEIPGA